jgi:hypothetical protein
MDSAQKAALEGLVNRSLTAQEIAEIDLMLPARNDVEITAILNVGRVRIEPRIITERGIRAALPVKDASRFMTMLKSLSEGPPAWLPSLLTAAGIPADEHADYAETLACAYSWLRQEAGLDIGVERTRSMMDLLAAAPDGHATAVTTIKSLAEVAEPLHYNQVSDALNIAEGRMTL